MVVTTGGKQSVRKIVADAGKNLKAPINGSKTLKARRDENQLVKSFVSSCFTSHIKALQKKRRMLRGVPIPKDAAHIPGEIESAIIYGETQRDYAYRMAMYYNKRRTESARMAITETRSKPGYGASYTFGEETLCPKEMEPDFADKDLLVMELDQDALRSKAYDVIWPRVRKVFEKHRSMERGRRMYDFWNEFMPKVVEVETTQDLEACLWHICQPCVIMWQRSRMDVSSRSRTAMPATDLHLILAGCSLQMSLTFEPTAQAKAAPGDDFASPEDVANDLQMVVAATFFEQAPPTQIKRAHVLKASS